MCIRQKLHNLKKGGKSVSEYIPKINNLLEALIVAGEKMNDVDVVVVLLVLAGLGDDFESLIQNVTSRRDEVTYKELKSMLVDIEVRRARTTLHPLSA